VRNFLENEAYAVVHSPNLKGQLQMAALLLCVLLLLPLAAFADNGGISLVPEAATMILMGTGLIGLASLGRKRFKK
jgi:hypothetical protein